MKSVPARNLLWLPILTLLVMIAAPRLPAGPVQTWILRASLPELLGCSIVLILLAFLLENPRFNSWAVRGLLDTPDGAGEGGVISGAEVDQRSLSGDRLVESSRLKWDTSGPESGLRGRVWLPLGLAILVSCLAYLERMQPFYFTQDDNLSQFLPTILQGCRSLWEGIFPTWNPYQFLGAPTASLGTYALTYPPTYVSYWVARGPLHNEFLTCDVFCITHLIAGYFTGYWACREARLSPALSATGSLCLALSGFMLVAGRSWYYMTPVLFWSPLLVISTLRLQQGRVGWKWALWTGLAIGCFFHAGNAQMWVYALLFWAFSIIILVITRQAPVRSLAWVLATLILGVGIACPLLVPQALATAHVVRPRGYGASIEGRVGSFLFPLFVGEVGRPEPHSYSGVAYAQLYYSGTLFSVVSFWAASAFVVYRSRGRLVAQNIWLACGVVAFLLAMGPSGGLWSLLDHLPPFNKFQHPLKFLAFLNLFVVLTGGRVVQRYLDHSRKPNSWEAVYFFGVCGLLLYHCTLSKTSLYWYADKPYPVLPPAMASLLLPVPSSTPVNAESAPGSSPSGGGAANRIMSFAPMRSPDARFSDSLQHNFPTVWQIAAVAGYDPLVENGVEYQQLKRRLKTEPLPIARAYGVRWLIVHPKVFEAEHDATAGLKDWETADPDQLLIIRTLELHAAERVAVKSASVWELSHPSPLAFALDNPDSGLSVNFNGGGEQVRLPGDSSAKTITVASLWRPEWKAFVDGKRADVRQDHWGRIVVAVPAGSQRLELRYSPPFRLGFATGFLLCTGAGFLIFGLHRKAKNLSMEGTL